MRFSSSIRDGRAPVATSGPLAGRTECDLGQLATVHAAIRIQNLAPKVPHHFVINRFPRLHQRMRNPVRLHQTRTQSHKHLPDHRLARGNPASQPNFQHEVSGDNKDFTAGIAKTPSETEKTQRKSPSRRCSAISAVIH